MKLTELKQIIDRYVSLQRPHEDHNVAVAIKLPYSTVAGQPTVIVKSAQLGFDWDAGKLIFYTEEDLTPADRDFAKQMREMQDRAGWADHENRNLKAEIKQLKKKIQDGAGGKYSDIVSDGGMDPRK